MLGIAGLIFQVDEAVFVGLTLFPWEIRMILAALGKQNKKLVKVLVGLSALVGVGYFLWQAAWIRVAALIGVEAYIYWVVSRSRRNAVTHEKDEGKK